jgi:hypothetical protein
MEAPVEVNITETKVLDENRLMVTFDKKVFLPEDPISMVSIVKSSDKSPVKVVNISLSEDEKSLIVLTSDNLSKEEYTLSINEVIDGETKKKMAVVN